MNEVVHTSPTIGSNVEEVNVGSVYTMSCTCAPMHVLAESILYEVKGITLEKITLGQRSRYGFCVAHIINIVHMHMYIHDQRYVYSQPTCYRAYSQPTCQSCIYVYR